MTKSELKEIIRETILTEMEGSSKYYPGGKTPGLTKKVMDTILMNIAKGGVNDVKKDEEKIYTVYFTYGVDDNDDVDVKANTPEEAVSLTKPEIMKNYKNARGFIGRIKQDL